MSELLTYELLKDNNKWTIGTKNSILNIISKDASFNNLLIENGILKNDKLLDQILLEDNSNNKLLNLKQIDELIKSNNLSDNNNILVLQNLFNDLSDSHYTLRSEFDILDESAVRIETFNDLSDSHYILRNEFDILDGSAVRIEIFNDLSDSHYTIRNEFDVLDGSAVRIETFNDLSDSHYTLRSEFDNLFVFDNSNLKINWFQDVSFQNVDISQVLNVTENINLNNSNTFINVLESDNSSNKVMNTQQNMGMLNEYIGEKTKALLFMNNISTLATTYYELTCDNITTNNNGVNNFVVDTSYISFVDVSNYGDCLLELYCHCDANTGSSSADNYIIFDLSAIEPVINNTLSIVDIDTRSVSKGLTLHMAFGTSSYKLMNTTNGIDFTKSIDFNNKYVMRAYTGVGYDLTELKLCLKITKLNY